MQKMYTTARIAGIFIFLAVVMVIYIAALYNAQIYRPGQYAQEEIHQKIITRKTILPSARGNIYDRNGVLLASGRPSHNIRLDFGSLRGMPETNDIVLELVYAAIDEGIRYTDTFPVTRGAPFEYLPNMTQTQRNRLDLYLDYHDLDPDIDVSDLLAWFRDHYKIDITTGILDARLIIGVRYELEVRAIVGTIVPYVFAMDVDTNFVTYLAERNLTGVYTETAYTREYNSGSAPHIIGYIGLMNDEEYAYYKELGYPMTAQVGKIGVERAFEEYLHGVDGERTMLLNEYNAVLRDEITVEPVPGAHIYLTLDLDLQITAENALRARIEYLNTERRDDYDPEGEEELELVTGGAVVAVDIKTGEILACVSYPTFNLSTLAEDWSFISTDPNFPMLNRATHGSYSPGSTFKMVTALAGLRNINTFNRYTTVNDVGRFTKYEDTDGFAPRCWIYGEVGVGHGPVDMTQALECSCNYYFMQVADWLAGGNARGAAEMFDEASMDFGLGIETGVELSESTGRLANPEVTEKYRPNDPGWYSGDVVLTGFGQSIHRFTPLQLANYTATIANDGARNKLTFLRRVVSSDFSDNIYEQTPVVIHQIEETDYIAILREGMRTTVTGDRGTARSFADFPVPVAAKTGTSQGELSRINDGVFVCYAPADDPQIAIAVVVEKGGSGGNLMPIARMILDRYFMSESTFLATPYGQLIP